MSSTDSLLKSLLALSTSELSRRASSAEFGSIAKAAAAKLSEFVKGAWPILEPSTPLVWSWYLDALCDAIQRQVEGDPEYRRLLICVPPGTMKSLLVNVFAPAWEWLPSRNPSRRKLFFANDDSLAKRDSRKMRELITNEWYVQIVRELAEERDEEPWTLAKDQNEKVNFQNTVKGSRQCLSLGSSVTGKRADDLIVDDPLDAKDVVLGSVDQVARRLTDVANILETVLPSRVDSLRDARWTMIMQRLHENDPAGRAIREGGWKVVEIQMEFDPDNPRNHPDDPRTEEGELLDDTRFPAEELETLKVRLGNDYHSQYQQRPRPRSGGPLKRHHWRFWYPANGQEPPSIVVKLDSGELHECVQAALPDGLDYHTQSWDLAFKGTKTSAFVVGQVWAAHDADAFLLDQIRERLDINGTLEAIRILTEKYPHAAKKLIEDKANGPAVIGMLQNKVPGIIPVNPHGGKEARANAAAPLAKSGNIYLPHPALFPWVAEFIDECEAVPGGQYWDQVDTFTQYVTDRYLGDLGPEVEVI